MAASSTETGRIRDGYAAIERRPSRFADPGAYAAWCERAEEWADRGAPEPTDSETSR